MATKVVIPYQFRSVSMVDGLAYRLDRPGRNPLSIQVCFNVIRLSEDSSIFLGRNPLSIQVCFNSTLAISWAEANEGRNPLSIQVCFNGEEEL